jgi:predicted negative regulator of RcsB-dependent stress response
MAKTPDNRPSQVQTTDLSESRINDDFVFWLKKQGPNYLLVALLAACAAMGYNLWQRKQVEKSSLAWQDLQKASIPEEFDVVAKTHATVLQVAMMANMQAGDLRLGQIRSGELIAKQGETPAVLLDEATRKATQDAADANYASAADLAVKIAGGKRENAITVVLPTLFGRAAVAESRGDFEGSRKLLEEAATFAGTRWPQYEKLAKWRASETLTLATAIPIPTAAELPVKPVAPAPGGATGTGSGDALFDELIREQAAQETPGGTAPSEGAAPAVPVPGAGG